MNRPAPEVALGNRPKWRRNLFNMNTVASATSSRKMAQKRGRHVPAVQQWSDHVRLVTISPNGAPGHFDAILDGEIVRSSRTPFTDTARVLLDRGADSNSWLIRAMGGGTGEETNGT